MSFLSESSAVSIFGNINLLRFISDKFFSLTFLFLQRTFWLIYLKFLTFDLAVFWKDYANYDKLILEYDTYNVDGSITGTVFIVLPEISSLDDDIRYSKLIETIYNGESQSKSDLQEILE